jgi:predicted metal-dependent enzyme (double-stranded beta helix superfamily)
MSATIASLLDALDQAEDLSPASIERILAEHLPSKEEVLTVSDVCLPYGRSLLRMNDKYEVIIGTWPKGGWCDVHDHGNAEGVVYSYGGEVVHNEYRYENGSLELFHRSQISGGESARLYAGMIHSLHNISSDEPYVGLHIYSPPSTNVRVFDIKTGDIYHIADDAPSIVPSDKMECRKVDERCFTFKDLLKEPAQHV